MSFYSNEDYNSKFIQLCQKYGMDPLNMNLLIDQTLENGFNVLDIKWTLSSHSKKLSSQEKIDNMKKVKII